MTRLGRGRALRLVAHGLYRRRMTDGRTEEVPVPEPLYVELLGRTTTTQALVLGDTGAARSHCPGRARPGGRLPPQTVAAERGNVRSTPLSGLEALAQRTYPLQKDTSHERSPTEAVPEGGLGLS